MFYFGSKGGLVGILRSSELETYSFTFVVLINYVFTLGNYYWYEFDLVRLSRFAGGCWKYFMDLALLIAG